MIARGHHSTFILMKSLIRAKGSGVWSSQYREKVIIYLEMQRPVDADHQNIDYRT